MGPDRQTNPDVLDSFWDDVVLRRVRPANHREVDPLTRAIVGRLAERPPDAESEAAAASLRERFRADAKGGRAVPPMLKAAASPSLRTSTPPALRRSVLRWVITYVSTVLLLILTVGGAGVALIANWPSGGDASTDWPMWGGDSAHTRVRAGAGPEGQPTLLWTYPAPGAAEPLVALDRGALADGVLYLPTDTGIVALDATTGRERWRAAGYGDVVVVDGDGLIVHGDIASETPSLARLRRADGSVVWTAEAGQQQPMWNPIVANGVGYTPSGTGFITFDPATGKELWRVPLAIRASRGAAVANGMAVLGDVTGNVYGISISKRTVVWTVKLDATTVGHPAIANGAVYVPVSGGAKSLLVTLDAATGAVKWRFAAPSGAVVRSPAVDGTTVYLPCDDGTMYALNAATGASVWNVHIAGPVGVNPPALVGDTLYFTSKGGIVNAVDRATGAERWQLPLGGYTSDAALIGDRVFYVSTRDGHVHAIGESRAPPNASPTAHPVS